jgi:hypothetical protein
VATGQLVEEKAVKFRKQTSAKARWRLKLNKRKSAVIPGWMAAHSYGGLF